jgi:hypothetical protein
MIRKKKDEDLNYPDEITEFHQLPDLDPSKEHVADKTCWCEPSLQYKNPETGNELWVHRLTQ